MFVHVRMVSTKMEKTKVKPSKFTFVSVFAAHVRTGLNVLTLKSNVVTDIIGHLNPENSSNVPR